MKEKNFSCNNHTLACKATAEGVKGATVKPPCATNFNFVLFVHVDVMFL